MCEQHQVVKVGCLSENENEYVVDGTRDRKYVFSKALGYWIGYPLEGNKKIHPDDVFIGVG